MSEVVTPEVVNEEPIVEETPAKTFTQDELDKIVADRLARDRKKYADYDEVKTRLSQYEKSEEERKHAEMTEVERLQAEKESALQKAKELEESGKAVIEKVNQRLVKSEFRTIAKELGIRKDAMDDAYLLADLSTVVIDDDGDVQGMKEALESLKKSKAFLFGANDFADPSAGQHEPKREASHEQAKRKLEELAAKAKRTGSIEDKIAYASFKQSLGL
jgi:hypothetical protein